jgi:hypothetical protein
MRSTGERHEKIKLFVVCGLQESVITEKKLIFGKRTYTILQRSLEN